MGKANTTILPEFSMYLNTLDYQIGDNSRSSLLPSLHAAQNVAGFISDEAILNISQSLEIPTQEIEAVIDFYPLFSRMPASKPAIHNHDEPACTLAGVDIINGSFPGMVIADPIEADAAKKNASTPVLFGHTPSLHIHDSSFHSPTKQIASRLEEISTNYLKTQILGTKRIITNNCGKNRTCHLMEYWSKEGYKALKEALHSPREEIINEIASSGLTGRGGESMLTGIKWEKAVTSNQKTRFVICNAAESDPTSFKDRLLLEEDPHSVLEGMIITGYFLEASKGFIYINGEYEIAGQVLLNAISDAREAGLLGTNILGSKYSFDIEIRRGAGRYIAGEETALMESIEGKCAYPRSKPPFPTVAGLFGKPTIINNVETYCCIPRILRMGAMEYRKIGTETSKGTILLSVSGDVKTPGLVEIPFGKTFREVIDGCCGGMPAGHRLQAVLVGGVNGTFLTEADLDIPVSLNDLKKAGISLGHGSIVVLNETRNIHSILAWISYFLADECCGKCLSCVKGTAFQKSVFDRPDNVKISQEEFLVLIDQHEFMQTSALCRFGKTAINVGLSAIAQWPDGFIR